MSLLIKRAVSLFSLILFLVPYLVTAQTNHSIDASDSFTSDTSMDKLKNKYSEEIKGLLGDDISSSDNLDGMPIVKPNRNAAIKIYHPPENLVFDMPIIGRKDTTKLKSEDRDWKTLLKHSQGNSKNK